MIKVAYTTPEEREAQIAEMTTTGKILKADAIHTDEKYLLFVDPEETEPYVLEPEDPQPAEIDVLEQRISELESKVLALNTSINTITKLNA